MDISFILDFSKTSTSDQLIVSGDLDISGALTLDYTSLEGMDVNDYFLIVDCSANVNGMFDGLNECDQVLQYGNVGLFITYKAGDGNDIALFGGVAATPPESVSVDTGSANKGGLAELLESDDLYLVLDPRFLKHRYQLAYTVEATSPTETPCCFRFSYESKTFNIVGTVDQAIELFNYKKGQFEQVDLRQTTTYDSMVSVSPGGDLTRFVEAGTGALQARISYENNLPFWFLDTMSQYRPFEVRADRLFWTISDSKNN